MQCLTIFTLGIVLTMCFSTNAFPMMGIQIPGIPDIPQIPGIPNIPNIPNIPSFARPQQPASPADGESPRSGADGTDSPKDVETMEKSESFYLGYSPYYYRGWPYYGAYHYPYVYIG